MSLLPDEQLRAVRLVKTFTLHNQGGVELPVLAGFDLTVAAGECVALHGPSGAGKSTVLRALYGNYLAQQGSILVRHAGQVVDLAAGRIVAEGAPAVVRSDPRVGEIYFGARP